MADGPLLEARIVDGEIILVDDGTESDLGPPPSPEEAPKGKRKATAEEYIQACKIALQLSRCTANELRLWWSDERKQREYYELTPEHEAQIAEMCKRKIAELTKPRTIKKHWKPRRARI